MTLEQAYKLLNPDSVQDEVTAMMLTGLSIDNVLERRQEALIVACECIKRCMEMEDDGK